MYDALCRYAKARKDQDKNGLWDGNVPASYETNDKPAKKLGRWINRQRSAYANKKLKKEFVDKLEKVGLKWTAMDSKKELETSEILLRQRVMTQPIRPAAQGTRTVMQTVRPGVASTARPVLIKNGTVVRQVVRQGVGAVRQGVIARPGTTNVSAVARTGVHPATVISAKTGVPIKIGNTKVTALPQARPSTIISSKVGIPTTVVSGKVTGLPQTRPGTLTTVGNTKVTTLPQARPITIVSAKSVLPVTTVTSSKATVLPQVRQTTIISSKPGVPNVAGSTNVTTIPQVRQPTTTVISKPGVPATAGNGKVTVLPQTRQTIVGGPKVTALPQARPTAAVSAKTGVPTTLGNTKVSTIPQVRQTTTIATKQGVPTLVGSTKVTNLPQRTVVISKPGVQRIVGNTQVTTVPQVRQTTVISSKPGMPTTVGNTKVTTIPQVRQPTVSTSKPGVATSVASTRVPGQPHARQETVITTKPGISTAVATANSVVQSKVRPITVVTSKTGVTNTTGITKVAYKSPQLVSDQAVQVSRPTVPANKAVVPSSTKLIATRVVNRMKMTPATATVQVRNGADQMKSGQMKAAQNTLTQIKSNQVIRSSHRTLSVGNVVQVAPRVTPTLITASNPNVSAAATGQVNVSTAVQKGAIKLPVLTNAVNINQLNAVSSPAATDRPTTTLTKKSLGVTSVQGKPVTGSQTPNKTLVVGGRPIAGVQGNASMSAISKKPVVQKLPSSLPASSAPNTPASSSALPGVASNKMC